MAVTVSLAVMTALAPAGSADSRIGHLVCVDLGAQITEPREALGVTESDLREALLVGVKARMPRLLVNNGCPDALRMLIVPGTPTPGVVYGAADLALLRRAFVAETGQPSRSEAWRMTFVFHGPPAEVKTQLLGILNDMLGRFAADYHGSGNP